MHVMHRYALTAIGTLPLGGADYVLLPPQNNFISAICYQILSTLLILAPRVKSAPN